MHQPNKWNALAAELEAEQGFYRALGEQAQRARRGEGSLPEVPPRSELTYVDGFLIWKGRPVWWSGESRPAAPKAELAKPGLLNPDVLIAHPPVRIRQPERARLRRWFPLRWRWAQG